MVDVYQIIACASKYSVPVNTVVWGFSAELAVGAGSTASGMEKIVVSMVRILEDKLTTLTWKVATVELGFADSTLQKFVCVIGHS